MDKKCGYRIAAIILPCQGRDTGSTPVTRSVQENKTTRKQKTIK